MYLLHRLIWFPSCPQDLKQQKMVFHRFASHIPKSSHSAWHAVGTHIQSWWKHEVDKAKGHQYTSRGRLVLKDHPRDLDQSIRVGDAEGTWCPSPSFTQSTWSMLKRSNSKPGMNTSSRWIKGISSTLMNSGRGTMYLHRGERLLFPDLQTFCAYNLIHPTSSLARSSYGFSRGHTGLFWQLGGQRLLTSKQPPMYFDPSDVMEWFKIMLAPFPWYSRFTG